MELTQLAPMVVAMIAPYLPHLVEAAKMVGEKALEKVGESVGEEGFKQAKPLLARIWPKIAAKPAALEAAEDVAKSPDNKSYQTVLEVQLEKILAADRSLLDEVKKIIEAAGGVKTNINVTGDRNVVIGRDNSGVIITGDSNKVEK